MSPPKQNAPPCYERRVKSEIPDSKFVPVLAKCNSIRSDRKFSATSFALLEAIKKAMPIEEAFRRDGHKLLRNGTQLKCLCPFHPEDRASCSVNPSKGVFHCFGCGAGGTIIDYHALKRGIGISLAVRELVDRLNSGSSVRKSAATLAKVGARHADLKALNLPWLERGTGAELKQLAVLRSIAVEALQLAQAAGVLWFGTQYGVRCWVVTDEARAVAQARRLDGKNWHHLDGAKAYTLPGGCASWPVGLIVAQERSKIMLIEGGPDLLAAYHLLWCETRDDITPVCMLGASASISAVALPLFERRRVRIYPHVDERGWSAAERWNDQLLALGCTVDCYDFSDLVRTDGELVQDLNDFLLVDHDQWESNLEEALP